MFINDAVKVVSSSVPQLDVIHLGGVVWYMVLLESQLGLDIGMENKPSILHEVSKRTGELGSSLLMR